MKYEWRAIDGREILRDTHVSVGGSQTLEYLLPWRSKP